MTIFVGETVLLSSTLVNPATKEPIDNAVGKVQVYKAGKLPKTVPEDRAETEGAEHDLVWEPNAVNADGSTGAYTLLLDTTGFEAGKRFWKASFTGAVTCWEYGNFTLAE